MNYWTQFLKLYGQHCAGGRGFCLVYRFFIGVSLTFCQDCMFTENFGQFVISQKVLEIKLLHVSYLVYSATLYSLLLTTKHKDRRIVILLRSHFLHVIGLMTNHSQKILHTFSWFPGRVKIFSPYGLWVRDWHLNWIQLATNPRWLGGLETRRCETTNFLLYTALWE
jgi:hypothetical protein